MLKFGIDMFYFNRVVIEMFWLARAWGRTAVALFIKPAYVHAWDFTFDFLQSDPQKYAPFKHKWASSTLKIP